MPFVRFAFVAVCAWCALVEIAEAFAWRFFSLELDGDWFLLLATSDSHEIATFVSLHAARLLATVGIFVALATFVALFAIRSRPRLILLAMLALAAYAGARIWACGKAWKPLYVAYDTVRSSAEYAELRKAGAWTPERTALVRPAPEGATNLVFVIGESLTPDRMSVYGYGKETTPGLAALAGRIAVLGPLTTTHPDTARALRMMLTRATREKPDKAIETLPVFLRQRGYRTALLSAQRHWERYCGVEQMIFAACESRFYLSDRTPGRPLYDGDLLPYVKEELARRDGRPFAVFVHLQGSHFIPQDRVPAGFPGRVGFDAYDQSVRYTDDVLTRLIGMIPEKTVLVFVSDHGESVDCQEWRNVNSPSMWRVPLLVYPAEASAPFRSLVATDEIWYNP